ncbi:MAG: hypothetical protein MOGDAGHF_01749 [Rhodocyclaceae bacterium]|jgi:hypothetical protein|nr:hypothetical protein [Rhodocyclaceae bacterium]
MKQRLLLLTIAALISGCVNLHVHFPEAADKPAEAAQSGAAK